MVDAKAFHAGAVSSIFTLLRLQRAEGALRWSDPERFSPRGGMRNELMTSAWVNVTQAQPPPEEERVSRLMKSSTEYLTFNLPTRMGFLNITPHVEEILKRSGIQEGMVLCNAMHITASVFINDDERGLHHDFGVWLERLAPFNPDPKVYHHNRTGEDNADAHMKRQVMGREVVVAITKGRLDFGPWEQIFYGEFDGNRPKRVLVKIIGE